MLNKLSVPKTLKIAALYDLLVTGILILPPVVPLLFGVIASLDGALGFNSAFAPPDRTTIFFVNLAAASVCAWAAIRLLRPSVEALMVDILFRAALIACQVWAVAEGATPILLGISAVLAAIAALEYRVLKTNRTSDSSQSARV